MMHNLKLAMAAMSLVTPAASHGVLTLPRSRQQYAHDEGTDWCPGGSAGCLIKEYSVTSANTRLDGDVCGTIGSRKYSSVTDEAGNVMQFPTQASYTAGHTIEVGMSFSAYHKGHVEFFLCEQPDALSQACFDKHPLHFDPDMLDFYDPLHPERLYLEPLATHHAVATAGLRLPQGLSCSNCVLQWVYVTSNSCLPPGYKDAPFASKLDTRVPECQLPYDFEGSTQPERFWNCADIAITCNDCDAAPSISPPTAASPTQLSPTTTPPTVGGAVTVHPTTMPTQTVPEPGCLGEWAKCGGQAHTGATCCAQGLQCYRNTKWYSQCQKSCPEGWECSSHPLNPTSKPSTPQAPTNQPPTPTPQPPTPHAPTPHPPTAPPTSGNKRMVAYVENWKACPTGAQLDEYTHIIFAFAVTYTWASGGNNCNSQCVLNQVDACGGESVEAFMIRAHQHDVKVLLSVGGAGMGGLWDLATNRCWDVCWDEASSLASQTVEQVTHYGFDGVDIDYEYLVETDQQQQFVVDLTLELRRLLPVGALLTHAPMDYTLDRGAVYYELLSQIGASMDFLMPQYYNGNLNVVTSDSDLELAMTHFGDLAQAMGNDASKVVFGFCLNDCAGWNAGQDRAAAIVDRLEQAFPDNGGVFFWASSGDSAGAWPSSIKQHQL